MILLLLCILIYRFGNQNVTDCWNQPLVQDFRVKTLNFMKEHCVKEKAFFREAGTEFDLFEAQKAIDKGLFDFLKKENCVYIIGPLFKRFLQSFNESIIPPVIAEIMRTTPSKHM